MTILGAPPGPALYADPEPPNAEPLILNNAYLELSGTNMRCLAKHIEISAENKPVTITSFCNEIDYPGVTKWHLRLTLSQTFDAGGTFDVLMSARQAFEQGGTPLPFTARAYTRRPPSATNPVISGFAIPQPFDLLMGDAGAASEVTLDWICTAEPSVDRGGVTATGASAGAPGFFTPSGATVPANLAALTGIIASPATAWAAGSYVITADLLANHWSGSAWAAGKAS